MVLNPQPVTIIIMVLLISGNLIRTPYTPHIPVKPLQLLHMFIKFNKNLEMVGDAAPVCLLGLQIPDLGLYVFVEKE
jgi:hypothetical protein